MTPEQALDLLRQATGLVKLDRKEHELINLALETLAKLLEPQIKPAL